MDVRALETALAETKAQLEEAIVTSSFKGKMHPDGVAAKTAAIRSSEPIFRVHEVVKASIAAELKARAVQATIHPAVGQSAPEVTLAGLIKKKDQDVTALFLEAEPETIHGGALDGKDDPIGRRPSETALVVGVRSQLSSVAKNFDTLMERAIAETVNLRLRLPGLVMGEVYLLSVFEYDDAALRANRVGFHDRPVKVDKFISTFNAISNRNAAGEEEIYKYERSVLLLADLRPAKPRLITDVDEMRRTGIVPADFRGDFESLSPEGFASDLLDVHAARHGLF